MRLARYLVRRVAAALFTLLALIAITFVVYWALPTAPTGFVYPYAHTYTSYQVDHANHLLGLDRSKPMQYLHYLGQLVRGDLGHSWTGSQLVDNKRLEQPALGPSLYPGLRITLSIILGGAALVLLLAVPLGAYSGTHVGSLGDRVVSTTTLVGICTHPMVLGLILATVFGVGKLGWLPTYGYCPLVQHAPAGGVVFPAGFSPCGGPADWASHLILPWVTFALLFLALYTRMIRASVAETLHEDYIRTARAKGASSLRIVRHHVLPPASLRVLTMVGMEIGTAFGICIYIESAFNIQGGLARQAVLAMGGATSQIDLPFTLGIVVLVTLIVVIGNFLVDTLYAVFDPRTGRESARGREKPLVGGVF
jgi:peptide/nickel transport system permease protein